jgi:hypothetical protein
MPKKSIIKIITRGPDFFLSPQNIFVMCEEKYNYFGVVER